MCNVLSIRLIFTFFFFKQKTAYELRISDWSSDVCSSDLPLYQRTPGAVGAIGGRQPDEGQIVSALIMLAFGLEPGAAFLIDQPGGGIGKYAVGIAQGLAAFGLEEQGPAGAEAVEQNGRPSCGERVCQYV